jgi:hypothetical protein
MNRVILLGIAPLVLVACDRPVAPASSNIRVQRSVASARDGVTRENLWIDEDGVFFSRCAQEDIRITGRTHVVSTTTVDGSKTTYNLFSNTANYRGVGLTSGNEYQFTLSGRDLATYESEPPVLVESYLHGRQVTVIKGEGRFVRIHAILYATFDGTTFTEWQKKFVFECPGVPE